MSEEPGRPLATFRPTIRHLCRFALGLFIGVAVLATVVNVLKGQPVSFMARGLLASGIVFGALVPLLAAIVWPLGLTVYSDGVRGRSKWGRMAFIHWSDILELTTHHTSGLAFVIINDRSGRRSIWTLPDVLSNPELQRLVSSVAGQSNPILVGSSLAD